MRKAGNLATFLCRLSENPGSLKILQLLGPTWACTGKAVPLTLLVDTFTQIVSEILFLKDELKNI
jgi:hypothetical protein